MQSRKSCGFLIIRGQPVEQFLLMRHRDRWDLPKGHVDAGETELQCALRELAEETGLTAADIEQVPNFRWVTQYQFLDRDATPVDKTLVVFLARLVRERPIQCTEHPGWHWFPWNPPHRIQAQTIDPLLAAVEAFVEAGGLAKR